MGCAALTDVGKRALVPYTADYFFWHWFSIIFAITV